MAGRSLTRLGFLFGSALVAGALFTACSSSDDSSPGKGGSGGSAGSATAGASGSNATGGTKATGGTSAAGGSDAAGGTQAAGGTGGSTETGGAPDDGNAEAGSDAGGEGGAPVVGPTACNDVTQQGTVVTPVNSAAAVPPQTRGPISPGTYVLTSQTWYNTANLNQARTPIASTVQVSVVNFAITLEFRGLLIDTGAFTLLAELPSDQTKPPTSVTVTCTGNAALATKGMTVPIDYTASATTIKIADGNLSTLDVYTKL